MTALTLNPDLALTLITIGVLGICLEFLRPGTVLPGVAGCVIILVAGRKLPVQNAQGIWVAILALAMVIFGAWRQAKGYFAIMGAALLTLAAVWMNPRIHIAVAIANLVPLAWILNYLFSNAVRARRNKRWQGTIS